MTWRIVGLVDRMAPFPQLVYNGVFAMNPFTRTVNFTAQTKYWQLKLIEFGGRPVREERPHDGVQSHFRGLYARQKRARVHGDMGDDGASVDADELPEARGHAAGRSDGYAVSTGCCV